MVSIQTVLLKKDYFKNRTNASKWIRKNKYKITPTGANPNKQDKTHFRYRQRQPELFNKNSFRTKKINEYVSFVIGELNKK
jgi:hypothetical protein